MKVDISNKFKIFFCSVFYVVFILSLFFLTFLSELENQSGSTFRYIGF